MAGHSHRGVGFWFATACLLLLVLIAGVVLIFSEPHSESDNPVAAGDLYIYPHTTAARQAALASGDEADAFAALAAVPTAVWLLPEQHPTAEVAQFVAMIEADAAAKSQVPVLVVYGLPSRDCGSYSAGGASARDYPFWVSAISEGIADHPTIVIVEPDSLSLSPRCGSESANTGFVADAVSRLNGRKTSVYLDGGNSDWLSPEQMVPLLTAAGVESVRGFATNVSNFNSTDEEREYGERLSSLLGGAHFVIDVSRNGNGPTGDWCNPPGRAVGAAPSGADGGAVLDGNLWIKNPGESDGECNGGPPAGQWWAAQALELADGR